MTGKSDTIFALASGRPPAGIAVVRVSGPLAHEAGRRIAGKLPPPRRATHRQFIAPQSKQLLDDGLLLRFDQPASATGENVVEFQIHGSRAVVDALLHALASIEGLRAARPGEFTRRAFENGRIDLIQVEGLADLLEAETETQRRAALALAEGALSRQIARWQEQLLALSARAEAAIDYVGEDDEDGDQALYYDCGALASEWKDWLERPRIEPLSDGVKVVVAGPPNAGKSSLINVIVGSERAIVTEIPGTTRDHIEVPLSIAGVPLLLTDTAGLRESRDPVERIGIARARDLASRADILLWLGDRAAAPEHPRILPVHPRCDAPGRRDDVPEGYLAISSVTGEGVSTLLDRLGEMVAALIPTEDALALNRRQAAHLEVAQAAVARAAQGEDIVFLAEDLRAARAEFDRMTGRAGVDDVLDSLFGRFCLGK